MTKITAILPAAGMGTRMGRETPKQFLELDGAPIFLHTLRRLATCDAITEIILATRADEVQRIEELCRREKFRQSVHVVKADPRGRNPSPRPSNKSTMMSSWSPFMTRFALSSLASKLPASSKKPANAALQSSVLPRWTP